jgi:hypothetical protein
LNAWTHIALARSSGTTKLFINGVQSGVSYSDSNNYGASARVRIGADDDGSPNAFVIGFISNVRVVKGTAVYTTAFTPPTAPLTAISGTSLLTCQNNYFKDNSSNAFAVTPNGNPAPNLLNPFNATAARSVNNATSTGTKRPKLAARYNLLTYTEQFDNGAWTKSGATAANTTATTDPLGGTTADRITESVSGVTYHGIAFFGITASVGATYTLSIYAKADTRSWVFVGINDSIDRQAWFNLSTGVIGTVDAGITASIQSVGNGWYRCSITRTITNSLTPFIDMSTGDGVLQYAGNGTSGLYLWGADLRPSSQATGLIGPTYQRVVDAATYDTAGFLPYLQFDGIDDSMSTGSIDFTATDKMTVWAGVRKLSDALAGTVCEFSTNAAGNAGAFGAFAPDSVTTRYSWYSRGSVAPGSNANTTASQYLAPVSNVFTGIGEIANDVMTLRLNSTQVATISSDQGTGNYGNYPLYIGARNNASFPFNGWLTSLIVRGAQSTQSQIEATESWVNQRTGAY